MGNSKITYLQPENEENLMMWARKWKVSSRDVHDAILNTGCLETEKLRKYIHRDNWLHHPVSGAAKIIRAGINLIF